jgi:glycosyltransferase involved in cell wall biosynthesis
MPKQIPHICVCVCTYKRPDLLGELLHAMEAQETNGVFTYSLIVADNDPAESARQICMHSANAGIPVTYCVESQSSIAAVRNKALSGVIGDFIAFIDDDERPDRDWLLRLYKTCESTGAAGVLGPVRPRFGPTPPTWAVKSRLFHRPEYPTGTHLTWRETRTGNALVRRPISEQLDPPFRPQFVNGGEDQDYFRRLIERGHIFVWCNEAPVHEFVPKERLSRRYLFRRALLRGQNERTMLTFRSVTKSAVAVMLYLVAMPFLILFGQHVLIRNLVKFFDHTGKLCAALGLRPMGEKYLGG